MTVRIICVGKLKEAYLRDAFSEYSKRISRFCSFEVTELSEYKLPDSPSEAQVQKAVAEESAVILRTIQKNDYVIALDVGGTQLSSEEFSSRMSAAFMNSSSIAFVIGGSNGYNDAVRARANLRLSFSKMTFPHQLFRIMLAEQIYRAFKIASGEKYHK
ncbi:MAG: 23S rRNA (pseudouridine(1915)-N(3))-methyltransferase RlmH [Clostridia bacterium]|nr:23S rRNA (pseudouridine(1915)-N(3))-methyltransferase RlmH [Clostridia bacterium]